MLVLSRKQNQEVLIGDHIKITVLKTRGNTVRLGIEAPRDIKVVRGELDAEPSPGEDQEEDAAEFTIVFGSDSETESGSDDSQTVQFTSDQPSPRKHRRSNDLINRLQSENDAGTIRYKGRLPRVLKHNRLKEIVDRIAADNAVSRVKK
jgi:carbon storage regulator CsrA